MSRKPQEDTRTRAERLQAILRLIREHSISRQEELQEYLNAEGYEVTQATISRDIRELCLVKAATDEGYRYVSSHSDRYDPKVQERFETIFRESVLGVDYAGHIVMIKCYPGMANAACQVFDSMQWKNVVGVPVGRRHLSGGGPLGAGRQEHQRRAGALHCAQIRKTRPRPC